MPSRHLKCITRMDRENSGNRGQEREEEEEEDEDEERQDWKPFWSIVNQAFTVNNVHKKGSTDTKSCPLKMFPPPSDAKHKPCQFGEEGGGGRRQNGRDRKTDRANKPRVHIFI